MSDRTLVRRRRRKTAPDGPPLPPAPPVTGTRARRVVLFGVFAAALAVARLDAAQAAHPGPPAAGEAAVADESAARERIRVLRVAAETGRDSDIDAFVGVVAGWVRERPGSPLGEELRRDLPPELKAAARRAERKGEGRRALALYRTFERLPFAPPDKEVTRRRQALESAFVAARISPVKGRPVVAHENEDLAIPVRWAGRREGLSGELHFRNRLSRQWRTVPVVRGARGVLQAVIPGEAVVLPEIEYWSEVRDAAGTVRRSGSAERPLVARVLRR